MIELDWCDLMMLGILMVSIGYSCFKVGYSYGVGEPIKEAFQTETGKVVAFVTKNIEYHPEKDVWKGKA